MGALVGVLIAVVAALGVVSSGGAANNPKASPTNGQFRAVWTPLGVSNAPTTVVVEIKASPIWSSTGIRPSRAPRMMRRCRE